MTSVSIAKEIAVRFVQASVQAGAHPGDILGPNFWPGDVHMPGLHADFDAGKEYAAHQGWVDKLPGDQYRLTDAGYAMAL